MNEPEQWDIRHPHTDNATAITGRLEHIIAQLQLVRSESGKRHLVETHAAEALTQVENLRDAMAQADGYDLRALHDAATSACVAAAARTDLSGPVNWAGLFCSDAARCESYDGEVVYRVEIRKADPGADALRQYITEHLAANGFPGVEVVTEW